jgi:hypothetical protein
MQVTATEGLQFELTAETFKPDNPDHQTSHSGRVCAETYDGACAIFATYLRNRHRFIESDWRIEVTVGRYSTTPQTVVMLTYSGQD